MFGIYTFTFSLYDQITFVYQKKECLENSSIEHTYQLTYAVFLFIFASWLQYLQKVSLISGGISLITNFRRKPSY